MNGYLIGRQPRFVHPDPRSRAARLGNGHLAEAAIADDLPMRSARAVAEYGARPVGEYRNHPSRLPSQPSLSDCIDPAVERVEALALHPMVDRTVAQPQGGKLRSSHHPVLPLSKLRDLPVVLTRLTFPPYYVVKVNRVAHARQDGGRRVTAG